MQELMLNSGVCSPHRPVPGDVQVAVTLICGQREDGDRSLFRPVHLRQGSRYQQPLNNVKGCEAVEGGGGADGLPSAASVASGGDGEGGGVERQFALLAWREVCEGGCFQK